MIKKVTIIGSGNVATQIGIALKRSNIIIKQVISRNKRTGQTLANELDCTYSSQLSLIEPTDLIMISTNDDSIEHICHNIPDYPTVHTSGNTSIKVLKTKRKFGVIYPVQSLQKEDNINFQHIPICIEASSNVFKKEITQFVSNISKAIFYLNSNERQYIHLSAVIACNFTNHLYYIAKELLDEKKLDFDILKPLIISNANKIKTHNPIANQTGPAKRKDTKTIKEHLELIDNIEYKKIYNLISNNIIEKHGESL
jgi:predicted short-subunit dehydrogenase-like oxidoreductase (DUF2520 family)